MVQKWRHRKRCLLSEAVEVVAVSTYLTILTDLFYETWGEGRRVSSCLEQKAQDGREEGGWEGGEEVGKGGLLGGKSEGLRYLRGSRDLRTTPAQRVPSQPMIFFALARVVGCHYKCKSHSLYAAVVRSYEAK